MKAINKSTGEINEIADGTLINKSTGAIYELHGEIGGSATGTLQYTIAAPNSVNKERADLILGTEDPAQQINDAIAMLHNARGGDTTIAIRIDFMGGVIEFAPNTGLVIPEGYDNIYFYGNGVQIIGSWSDYGNANNYGVTLAIKSRWHLYDVEVESVAAGEEVVYCHAISVTDCKLVNCTGIVVVADDGGGIIANNCILISCNGTSSAGDGISANNCELINCEGTSYPVGGIKASNSSLMSCNGTSSVGNGIYATNCKIIGCTGEGLLGDLYISGTSKPSTQELLEEFNAGSITIV